MKQSAITERTNKMTEVFGTIWRSIETAPKDGTAILLTDARVLAWTHVAGWDEYQFRGETCWGWGRDDCDTFWHHDMFTHWMPLPAPPSRSNPDHPDWNYTSQPGKLGGPASKD